MPANGKFRVAVTGATGFVGRRLLQDCAAAGVHVSALTRSERNDEPGVRWIRGDLDDLEALSDLITGADCVVHLAGLTKALDPADFHKINTDATHRLIKLCAEQNAKHFIFLSSLAATRPTVSPYAASKAAAEVAIDAFRKDLSVTTIRAPAVLGPDDAATRPLFSNLARGFLPVPGGSARNARFSIIDVADLTALLLSLVQNQDDSIDLMTPYGHESLGWQEMAESAERTLKKPIRQIVIPTMIMSLAARMTDLIAKLNGKAQVFSSSKLAEMNAGDWIATTPLKQSIPLDETMRRCLTPFQNQSKTAM